MVDRNLLDHRCQDPQSLSELKQSVFLLEEERIGSWRNLLLHFTENAVLARFGFQHGHRIVLPAQAFHEELRGGRHSREFQILQGNSEGKVLGGLIAESGGACGIAVDLRQVLPA